jgi:hypothetical protein
VVELVVAGPGTKVGPCPDEQVGADPVEQDGIAREPTTTAAIPGCIDHTRTL